MATDMRSLSPAAKLEKRYQAIELRRAGRSLAQIAKQLGLSRTGVFNICKRHTTLGKLALQDAPGGRAKGDGRTLAPEQELLLRGHIIDNTPDRFAMPDALWNRAAVSRLMERELGIVLPVRTLALYLGRWGFAARRPVIRPAVAHPRRVHEWMTDHYPVIVAKSKDEGGEINWASHSSLLADDSRPPRAATSLQLAQIRWHLGRRALSMLSAVTNKGQLRWTTFRGPLDALILVDFLRRLIRGASKKVFLIMDNMRVPDERPVEIWLVEHEDDIEAFQLPAPGPTGA